MFSKLSDVLPDFTCAFATGNLWNICLGVNIWRPVPWDGGKGNIARLRELRTNSLPS